MAGGFSEGGCMKRVSTTTRPRGEKPTFRNGVYSYDEGATQRTERPLLAQSEPVHDPSGALSFENDGEEEALLIPAEIQSGRATWRT